VVPTGGAAMHDKGICVEKMISKRKRRESDDFEAVISDDDDLLGKLNRDSKYQNIDGKLGK
jgi:hypothetical protein